MHRDVDGHELRALSDGTPGLGSCRMDRRECSVHRLRCRVHLLDVVPRSASTGERSTTTATDLSSGAARCPKKGLNPSRLISRSFPSGRSRPIRRRSSTSALVGRPAPRNGNSSRSPSTSGPGSEASSPVNSASASRISPPRRERSAASRTATSPSRCADPSPEITGLQRDERGEWAPRTFGRQPRSSVC